MKSFNILWLILACMGYFMVSLAFAMPPAPDGPYQSIEDDFIQGTPVSEPPIRAGQQSVIMPEYVERKQANERSWEASTGRYQQGKGSATPPDNYKPRSQPGGNTKYRPMGDAR